MKDETFRPNRVLSYFQEEWKILFFVTVSGLIYNLGLLAGLGLRKNDGKAGRYSGRNRNLPPDAGAGHCLYREHRHCTVFPVFQTVLCPAVCQQRQPAYETDPLRNAGRKSRSEFEAEGTGNVLTKAILDVDDCVEGMRKFTTEIFDTGVALLAYACMLLWYDWKLAFSV